MDAGLPPGAQLRLLVAARKFEPPAIEKCHRAIGPGQPEQRRRGIRYRAELLLAVAQRLFALLARSDIAEHQDETRQAAPGIVNRGAAIVNRDLGAAARQQ